jgi:CBS-domain-containing membrane protein
LFVPFATSIVLVTGSPGIEAAQPRALIGGHLLAPLVGLAVVKIAGPGPFAAALAVGLAMVAMHLTMLHLRQSSPRWALNSRAAAAQRGA